MLYEFIFGKSTVNEKLLRDIDKIEPSNLVRPRMTYLTKDVRHSLDVLEYIIGVDIHSEVLEIDLSLSTTGGKKFLSSWYTDSGFVLTDKTLLRDWLLCAAEVTNMHDINKYLVGEPILCQNIRRMNGIVEEVNNIQLVLLD